MVTGGNSPPPGLGGAGGPAAAGGGAAGGNALAMTAPLGQNVVQQRNRKKQVHGVTVLSVTVLQSVWCVLHVFPSKPVGNSVHGMAWPSFDKQRGQQWSCTLLLDVTPQ